MSKKKTEVTTEQKAAPLSGEALQDRIKVLEAKIAEGEEGALKRVCSALKINPDDIKVSQVVEKKPEPIIECWVPVNVRVNMSEYLGKVRVPKSTFHVIQQALGDRRMRMLRELTGSKYILDELCQNSMAPRVIEQYDATGERIA